MTDNENKYRAFLSYSPEDNREQRPDTHELSHRCWGDWLHDALKTFSIPPEFIGQPNGRGEIIPARIEPIFRDETESSADAGLSAEVRQALEKSLCLVIICSPRSARSLQVNEAVRYFKQLGRGQNILPIVIAGEPYASEENLPGRSLADECFAPALRHPILPDGTLDLTRRAGRHIFVDARQGADKREILANDHRPAEADLAMAKIQMIALLVGVGFNGLWSREQKRHFFDFAEAQEQVREAQRQVREAQNKALEIQNLSPDVHSQIEAAQNQARAAQDQLREFQDKVRDTQRQLDEARQRTLAGENKILEAQNQLAELRRQTSEAPDVQGQLEALRQQVQAAQDKFLVAESQLAEAHEQVRAAQNQVLELQQQVPNQTPAAPNLPPAVPHQIQAAQNQVLEAQNLARVAQAQLQEFQHQVQATQTQLEEVRTQAQADARNVLAAQNVAQVAQSQLEAARNEIRELQNTQHQLEETRLQVAAEAEKKFLTAHRQAQEFQNQVRATESELAEARSQFRAAQSQVEAARNQAQKIQDKNRQARRLSKVLAVFAVLGILSAGVVWRQRHVANQAWIKANSIVVGQFNPAAMGLDPEQIRQALQNLGGTETARNLDELAAWIPRSEIPAALSASALLLNDPQRSHFQKWLLIRLGWTNPLSAMTSARAIDGKIVNDAGVNDSNLYLQLAVLDNWMKTDLAGAFDWVCQLPDAAARQRALAKIIPALVAHDPVQAIEQRQQLPDHDADDALLGAIMKLWVKQNPEAAAGWAKSQPRSESKNAALLVCIDELAKTDVPQALTLAESLPAAISRKAVIANLFNNWAAKNPATAEQFAHQHPELSEAAAGRINEAWFPDDWAADTNWFESLVLPTETRQPTETNILLNSTMEPVQAQPQE